MKINGINSPWKVYESQKSFGTDRTNKSSDKKDIFTLSDTAKEFQTALKAVNNVADFDQNKIDEVSKRFNSGNYNVSSEDIADKILNSRFLI